MVTFPTSLYSISHLHLIKLNTACQVSRYHRNIFRFFLGARKAGKKATLKQLTDVSSLCESLYFYLPSNSWNNGLFFLLELFYDYTICLWLHNTISNVFPIKKYSLQTTNGTDGNLIGRVPRGPEPRRASAIAATTISSIVSLRSHCCVCLLVVTDCVCLLASLTLDVSPVVKFNWLFN